MIDYAFERTDDERKGMSNLYDIVSYLRDPVDGCPWDKEQMPPDIIRSMQGEIYEYIDALNDGDKAHQSEELGDVFLNLFLLAKIHDQNGDFKLSDCLNDACEKYIRRHPHVFSNVEVSDSSDVLVNWDNIKRNVEGRVQKSFFEGVPKDAPELERCYSISKKAAKVGFDWDSVDGIYDKVKEELSEVQAAETQDERLDEIGDLLFTVVQLARKNHIKPQDALAHANLKFMKRFERSMMEAESKGLDCSHLTEKDLDEVWNIAKKDIR